MITAHHLVFGRKYQGLFKIPFGICNRYKFDISTRSGNLVIKMPDGEIINYNTPKSQDLTLVNTTSKIERIYATPFPAQDVDVVTNNGNNDVYSFLFNMANAQYNDNYNIQNLGDFWAQFPNLFSIHYNIYAYGDNSRRPTIKGNLFAFPKSVTRVKVTNLDVLNRPNYTYGNFDSFTNDMQLIYFNDVDSFVSGGSKYYGNLAKTPPNVNFLKITATNNSTLTYTSGKIWASSFDTLDIGNATLSPTETDNLFNDMANSITTAIGSKIIRLANCYRTSASNTAVAYLQSLGFSITIAGIVLDTSTFVYSEISGTNGYLPLQQSGALTFTTDRKGGNTAIQFGNGFLKTINNLPSSSTYSLSFWIKNKRLSGVSYDTFLNIATGLTSIGLINVSINKTSNNRLTYVGSTINNGGYVERYINLPPHNTWYHVVIVLNVSLTGVNNQKFFLNGVQQSVITVGSAEETANYQGGILQLGVNNNFLYADLDDIKIYNRELTQTEITNLYNE